MRMEPSSAPIRCPGLGSGAYATRFGYRRSNGRIIRP